MSGRPLSKFGDLLKTSNSPLNIETNYVNETDNVEFPSYSLFVVSEALKSALQYSASCMGGEAGEKEKIDLLVRFLTYASRLKTVSVKTLSEVEKLSFYLNLYHLMICHGSLVLTPPNSAGSWFTYFGPGLSYAVGDEVFCLSELEHCILRSGMNFPSLLLSKLVIPKTRYSSRYQLSVCDYRINFAMNCGSLSNPPAVPIYNPLTLDAQLTRASVYYLIESVEVNFKARTDSSDRGRGSKSAVQKADMTVTKGKLTVALPAIVNWYKSDFGRGRSHDVARICSAFLTGEKKAKLLPFVMGGSLAKKNKNLSVKYQPFVFKCRVLTLFEEDLFDMLLSL